jgi:predicted pyridoxine 5'-phosphate oxidase superfamily flavin-nucleotide-binding protein
MPNGRPRQRNTRHANRQRNIRSQELIEATIVGDSPVVQAQVLDVANELEQMEERFTRQIETLKSLCEKYRNQLTNHKKEMAKLKKLYLATVKENRELKDRDPLECSYIMKDGKKYIFDNESFIVYDLNGEPKFNAEMSFNPIPNTR